MPLSRNGSGVYSLPAGSTVANGDVSDATDINTPLADIAADLNIARPIVAGGTGATSASAARTALGLAIGTDVQAYDADLTAIAALSSAANKVLYATGSAAWALADFTAAGRALVDDADTSAMLTTLGFSTYAKTLIDDADASAVLTTLGVSTFVKTLLDDATSLDFLTTLGFGVAGSAPFYLPRAWVTFTGTGTVTIRASGNVSSVTDNGTGDYTINFTTAMADANYSYSVQAGVVGTSNTTVYAPKMTNMTASALTILTLSNGVAADFPTVSVVVFK